MRLSEAIRLGAMLRPQVRGALFDWAVGTGAPEVGSCALGAAMEASDAGAAALYFQHAPPVFVGPLGQYGDLLHIAPPKALRRGVDDRLTVCETITRLNDGFGWTREEIADWVQTVEDHLNPPTEENRASTHELVAV